MRNLDTLCVDTLCQVKAEVEATTLSDTLDDGKVEALLHALADKVLDYEAETLYETLSNMKAETLVRSLDAVLAKVGDRETW